MISPTEWRTLSEAYAFLGNSLLKPMSQTSDAGLSPEFWEKFPTFGSKDIECAVADCIAFGRMVVERIKVGGDAVESASVEYTHLFVGPPRPFAAPWETMHRREGANVGFGEPAFALQALLRDAGLKMSNDNNQYADHMGIELLYLSEMCRRAAETTNDAFDIDDVSVPHAPKAIVRFVTEHPLAWIGSLRAAVAEEWPEGYFAPLLGVTEALLRWHSQQ
ncbi:TorD/DmsD family molecular chaperone [Slackia piriformis]|uniref:TorD/DmsD family molecular chaperone n=1 Tax=Slackia piriformis TaxID=626934 RepID=UPI0032BFFE43